MCRITIAILLPVFSSVTSQYLIPEAVLMFDKEIWLSRVSVDI